MSGELEYRASELPGAAAIAALYEAAKLRLPDFDPARIKRAVQGSNVTLACFERLEDGEARHAGGEERYAEGEERHAEGEERLVGFLRGWTDFEFDGYVCDLAVHPDLQHRGIGRELVARATSIGAPGVRWVLLASPLAGDFYGRLGWEKLDNAWKGPAEGESRPAGRT